MLTKLTFMAGSTPQKEPLEIQLSPVTIFVGPNNSGKSRALIEIENSIRNSSSREGLVTKSIEFEGWTEDAFREELSKIKIKPHADEKLHSNEHILVSKLSPQHNTASRIQFHERATLSEACNPNNSRNHYSQYLNLFTLRLDGNSRLALTNDQSAGDLQQTPHNHLAHLFVDNKAREEVRRIVYEAFSQYLVVDPTNIGSLRLRLSPRPPVDEREEKGWDSTSVAFHANASLLRDGSDGVKAFVGMLTTLIAGEPKITLIDEPEAFLHPSLCSRLGKEITSALTGTNRRLFVSTHSASFVMGCVQGGAPINIVRLTYDYSTATARLLPKEKLTPLMRNPLLRSVGVLNALFYSAVIVTEADADRAFYQEINERLLQAKDPRGIEGCLFLNAQNKQTVWDIVHPLRELGIPTVGIVDIDVLKEGGAVWKKPMNGAFVPPLNHEPLNSLRKALYDAFNATGKNMKTAGGVEALPSSEKEACLGFFSTLAEYGVFVVPCGEIESWLAQLTVTRSKGSWLTSIFEAMGEDPASPSYVRPSEGDVWDFIGSVKSWVSDPSRKGVPE